jgi:aerobic carbon-monoxide dehydrogenase medium subunit
VGREAAHVLAPQARANLASVRPATFEYFAPRAVDEALELLARHGSDAKPLAGGQSLVPMMNMRLARPAVLVDLNRVAALAAVRAEPGSLRLGALVRQSALERDARIAAAAPLLAEAAPLIGHLQTRARGTVGGSLAHADPAGDLPAVAMALDAQVHAVSNEGQRTIPAANFFVDLLTTALKPNELLTSVTFAATDQPGTGTAYAKHRHPASGYAVVGVAAVVQLAADGTCQGARVGITGAGTHAVRAGGVETALMGRPLDPNTVAAACNSAPTGMDLLGDTYASADFRAHLTRVLARRAILEAASRARG